MEINLKELSEAYVSQKKRMLEEIPTVAGGIPVFERVCIKKLNKESLSGFEFTNALYFFKIINPSDDIAKEIRLQVQQLKDDKDVDLKLPLVNKESNNEILYVGKSSGKFITRLRQHLFADSKSTYALHLSEWKNDNFQLELHYTSVSLNNEHENVLLEELETILHLHLKPILGRTGH